MITFGNEEPATESNKNENKGFYIEALKRLMVFQDRLALSRGPTLSFIGLSIIIIVIIVVIIVVEFIGSDIQMDFSPSQD